MFAEVVVDFQGHPQTFDAMKILSDVVAKEVNVLKVDVPQSGGRGWKRTAAEISPDEVGDGWRQQIADGAKYVMEETWVKANDPHYDAKAMTAGIRESVPAAFYPRRGDYLALGVLYVSLRYGQLSILTAPAPCSPRWAQALCRRTHEAVLGPSRAGSAAPLCGLSGSWTG